jgi:hypothetical protein
VLALVARLLKASSRTFQQRGAFFAPFQVENKNTLSLNYSLPVGNTIQITSLRHYKYLYSVKKGADRAIYAIGN